MKNEAQTNLLAELQARGLVHQTTADAQETTKQVVNSRRCPECGGTIAPVAKPGRPWVLVRGQQAHVPESVEIPTCDCCGDEYVSAALAAQIDKSVRLVDHLKSSRAVYCGFDPTRDSLTIGNLVSVVLLRRFQLGGHRPVVIIGGGTGLIGDPSGKDAERGLLSREDVDRNIAGQRRIFERVLDFDGPYAAQVVNNADWLTKLSFVDVLRDIGKHFSVNTMLQRDSVKMRLEGREHGISYTEFSYILLQSYDFVHLCRELGVSLQVGGSDQWGNIVGGVDLTRRILGQEVFGLTTPLLTKADGGKFGKTETGAVWLTADRTSTYAFYQFWINASDADVANFLRVFSLKPLPEIEELIARHHKDPSKREAQKALAVEMTELLHGEQGRKDAELASNVLFSGEVQGLSKEVLLEVFSTVPSTSIDSNILGTEQAKLSELLVTTGVVKSKREARQFLTDGAISLNGERVDENSVLRSEDLLFGEIALIRRGKKNWHLCHLK